MPWQVGGGVASARCSLRVRGARCGAAETALGCKCAAVRFAAARCCVGPCGRCGCVSLPVDKQRWPQSSGTPPCTGCDQDETSSKLAYRHTSSLFLRSGAGPGRRHLSLHPSDALFTVPTPPSRSLGLVLVEHLWDWSAFISRRKAANAIRHTVLKPNQSCTRPRPGREPARAARPGPGAKDF